MDSSSSTFTQPHTHADAKTPPSDEHDLLNLLEPSEAAVRFIDDPYSSLLVFQSSSSYITINGNEETCGSSFSDSGTSLMASVDISGFRFRTKGKPDGEVLPLRTFI
ncbi:hypothetical protein SESBI_29360 [Sesbania bispinosa]|nr:hypothetical protein SESBI_29360 [Sesbania bispinosa]